MTSKKPKPKTKDQISGPELAKLANVEYSRITWLSKTRVICIEPGSKYYSKKKCLPIIKKHSAKVLPRRRTDKSIKEEKEIIAKLVDSAKKKGAKTPMDVVRDLLDNTKLLPTNAKEINELIKAHKELLEYDKMTEQLVNIDEQKKHIWAAGRHLRNSVLAVPVRIADQAFALNSPDAIEKLFHKELCIALENIPKGKEFGFLK